MQLVEINASFIPLTKNKVAIVDTEDYDYLNQWKWQTNEKEHICYAHRTHFIKRIKGKQIHENFKMHRVITNAPSDLVVDHINGNGLDNRKSNLRVVTRRQNLQNQVHRKNKSSKYAGVTWHKRDQKWFARIRIDGKLKYLGYFTDEREAAKAYEKACRELVGEELVCKSKGT